MVPERSAIRARVRRRENRWASLVVGLTILACGVLFWLDHLGRIDARAYLEWWPVALIALGLAHLPQRQWVGAAIWIGIGVIFLMPLVGLPLIRWWKVIGVWPLVYSAGGVALIAMALRRRKAGEGFEAIAVMAGNTRQLGALEFGGGEAIAVMGGCEIDLSAARLPREAIIDVLAFWGGIEIRVPRGWVVDLRATTILAGLLDLTEPAGDSAPRLVIRGSIIMGGVEIRHPAETKG